MGSLIGIILVLIEEAMKRLFNIISEILNNEGRPAFMAPLDVFRMILHIPAGILSAGLVYQLTNDDYGLALVGIIFTWGFFRYELNEDRHEKDKAFKDILGWLIGVAFSGILFYSIY